ncbi:MAG: hypothetical protein FRX49_01166 [Trebouxia sp. A1-2]|nr:MAG: hypothetical protein FRX49_01166 [Trebouxia sp. A1-2]
MANVLSPKRHSSSTRALADSKLTLGEAGRGAKVETGEPSAPAPVTIQEAVSAHRCSKASGSSLPLNLTFERRASTTLVRAEGSSKRAVPAPSKPPSKAASSWSRPSCPFTSYSALAMSGSTYARQDSKL